MDADSIPFLPREIKHKDPVTFNLKVLLAKLRAENRIKQGVFEALWLEAESIDQKVARGDA